MKMVHYIGVPESQETHKTPEYMMDVGFEPVQMRPWDSNAYGCGTSPSIDLASMLGDIAASILV